VQSMDPHKIDGLATVLAKVAKDRQVVVFTHDPRLVEATRRMKIPATVLEVVRQASSQVQIHRATDPVDQYLRDATSVLYSAEKLGEKVVGGLVSFQCRAAVEAASMEVVRRRKLSQSVSHKDVELELQKIKKVHDLVTLAVLGDVKYGAELYKRLNNWNARFADVFKALKEGSHGSSNYSGTWREMVERTRALTEKIRGCK